MRGGARLVHRWPRGPDAGPLRSHAARMDHPARARDGLVVPADLGAHPGRSATRTGLERLRRGAFVARTQPIDALVQVRAIDEVARDYVLLGATALWMYDLGPAPATVEVGVRFSTRLVAPAGVRVRRVADAVLRGRRRVGGFNVVALEVAVVQAAEGQAADQVVELVAEVLRSRRTTIPRLRSVLRKGFRGSAAVRLAIDELSGQSLDVEVRRLHKALERRGVTGLECEVRFVNAAGASCYADLLHRPTMTVVEMDGFASHTARARFRADRRRDRWLQAEHGVLTVRVVVGEDVEQVADEICAVLRRRADEAAA